MWFRDDGDVCTAQLESQPQSAASGTITVSLFPQYCDNVAMAFKIWYSGGNTKASRMLGKNCALAVPPPLWLCFESAWHVLCSVWPSQMWGKCPVSLWRAVQARCSDQAAVSHTSARISVRLGMLTVHLRAGST